MPREVEEQHKELVAADRWFTSRKHDPWQLNREIKAARKEQAAARSAGRSRRIEASEAALAEVEQRHDEARQRLLDREQLIARMEASAAEIRAVRGWMRTLLEDDVAPSESIVADADLDPKLAEIGRALREAWIAAREVDATAGDPASAAGASTEAREALARAAAEAELQKLG